MLGALALLVASCPLDLHAAPALSEDFTVEGRLYDFSGAPITRSVDFKFEIYDESTPTCVLYRELRSDIDLSSADPTAQGVFSLRMGTVSPDFTATTFATLFAPGAIAGDGCSVVAANGSHRLVKVSVRKHGDTSYEALSPDTRVTPVPLAKIAENALALQGVGTAALALLNPSTSLLQPNLEYVFGTTNYARLKDLIDGVSSLYISATPGAAVNFNGQKIDNLADPTAAQDAVTKAYADRTLAGSAVDVTAVGPMTGADNILKWDATASKWVAAPADRNPTGAAGGDLAGSYPNPTLAPNSVTNTKILDGAITTSKLVAVGGPNRLLMTDPTTGTTVALGSCSTNQIYVWSAMGWTCSTVAALSPVTSVAGRTGAITLTAADVGGLGTAALFDWGTAANQILRLDNTASLPAVNGAQLLNVNATKLQGRPIINVDPLPAQVLGWNGSAWLPTTNGNGTVTQIVATTGLLGGTITTSGSLSVDVGTSASKIVQLDANTKLPAVDGSQLTNVNATKLQSFAIDTAHPTNGQVLVWNSVNTRWSPATPTTGTVTNVTAGLGLTGGPIVATGTLNVDVGTSANKIVQLDSNAKLPVVDGSQLLNVNAAKLQSLPVDTALPSNGQVLTWNLTTLRWSPATPNAGTVTNVAAGTGLTGGPIVATGTLNVDVGTGPKQILQMTTASQIPAVDGSLLLNVNATKLQSFAVATTTPVAGQVLGWNGTAARWNAVTPTNGTVTSLIAGTGLTGGTITSSGSIAVDAGVNANQILQLNAAKQIPAVDGSLLKSLNASQLTTGTVDAARLPTLQGSMFGDQNPGLVLASPQTTAGGPTFRSLVKSDLPTGTLSGTAAAGYVPQYDTTTTLKASPFFVSGGNVGLNMTSPQTALDVNGSLRVSDGINVANNFLTVTSNTPAIPDNDGGGFAVAWNRSVGAAEVNFYDLYPDPGTAFVFSKKTAAAAKYVDLMTIKGNGSVGIGTTSPAFMLDVAGQVRATNVTAYSDVRLKHDVQTLDASIEKIIQLRGVSYLWNDAHKGEGPQMGFIAQEVEKVYPSVVQTDANGMKSVSYLQLVAPLVEAVKTLRQENEELRTRLERLERKLDQ